MNYAEVIRIALRALGRNKMRTLLTMLGIIIGVGAVICVVAIGQGAGQAVQGQIQSLGENMLWIQSGSVNSSGVRMGAQATKTLTILDAQAIQQQVPTITAQSPGVAASVQIVNGNRNWYTRANGVGQNFFTIRNWPVDRGSGFSQRDVDVAANVCVLGTTVAQQLFGDQDPIGQTVRVQNIPFVIIGELVSKGSTFGQDQDDTMFMPYTTVQKKIAGISWLQFVTASADSQDDIGVAEKQVAALLRQRHHLRSEEDDDFIIRSPQELADTVAVTTRILTLLLASIASVSLIVGGIGIMNIMLVSVTERTREIGVRMAVGATEQDVQRQFLSEAIVLSLLGGLIGIALGIGLSLTVSHIMGWPSVASPLAILIAVLFSAAVGIFFGYYPARKAARLDPIEALRYE
jgi:putative ABC transport system permease protein